MATPATKLIAGAFVALLALALAGADKVCGDRLVTPPPPPRSPSPPARPAAPPRPLLPSPPASHGKKTGKILAGIFAALAVAAAIFYALWLHCRAPGAVAAAPLGARAAAGGPREFEDQDPDMTPMLQFSVVTSECRVDIVLGY
ncbi:uncharacterized protein [Triticum aestivum]|uniref:uncharacterized protein n=1 Tax=Triticum aestivum TaxID=4565 RepID=UPI001D01ADAE|nr:uncharacterized protein LOC123085516 [Triticum aestivum]